MEDPKDVIVCGSHDKDLNAYMSWCLPSHQNFEAWGMEQAGLGRKVTQMTIGEAHEHIINTPIH
jgi:hypothetical protein